MKVVDDHTIVGRPRRVARQVGEADDDGLGGRQYLSTTKFTDTSVAHGAPRYRRVSPKPASVRRPPEHMLFPGNGSPTKLANFNDASG